MSAPTQPTDDRAEAVRESGSWYLDPLAAEQKRRANLSLVRQALGVRAPKYVLKTDLFEEANGSDQILFGLDLGQQLALGFDRDAETCNKARGRAPGKGWPLFVADARQLPLATGKIDLIMSTSTLDHMDAAEDLEAALSELFRVLKPAGRLALTLDNPWNPVYPILRAVCALPWAPFALGYTASRNTLDKTLQNVGFEPLSWRPVLHNPRIVSTFFMLAARRLLGARAAPIIRGALGMFDRLDSLPTRWITACFTGVCAEKPASPSPSTHKR